MQGYYKLNTNGTIQSRNKQVDNTWLPLIGLETKESGEYYTHYNQDGTPDLVKEQELQNIQLISKYESIYENIFTQKLIELDYKANGSTVAMYATIPSSIYYNECIGLINWREAMVTKNYEILNAVKNGTRVLPTEAEYLAELPTYTA